MLQNADKEVPPGEAAKNTPADSRNQEINKLVEWADELNLESDIAQALSQIDEKDVIARHRHLCSFMREICREVSQLLSSSCYTARRVYSVLNSMNRRIAFAPSVLDIVYCASGSSNITTTRPITMQCLESQLSQH